MIKANNYEAGTNDASFYCLRGIMIIRQSYKVILKKIIMQL